MFNETLFSIGITRLQLDGLNNEVLSNLIEENCKTSYVDDKVRTTQDAITNALYSERGIMPDAHPELVKLNDTILEHTQIILDGIIANPKIDYVTTYIKRIWGNRNVNKDISLPHAHRDSFLSVVYYPVSEDGIIHFYSPFSDAFLAQVPIALSKKFHQYNSSYYEFPVSTGQLVIFPSMLCHYVPPTANKRMSIAYDIGVNHGNI